MANVTVYIVSLPERNFLHKVVESVLCEPEVAQVVCVLNNYPPTKSKIEKIKIIHRENEKGCSEKFYDLKNCATKYAAFIDDDFTITSGYFARLIEGAEKHGGVVSYHGSKLNKRPISNYYHDRTVFHCRNYVANDVEVDIIGSGACLFEVSKMKNYDKLYDIVKHPNMSDLYLSALAKANKLKCTVVNHIGSEITVKPNHEKDVTIFEKYKNDCETQTNFINKYYE